MTAVGGRRPAPGEPHAAARRLAERLERLGLTTPAVLLLEAHRPVAPLIGAAATFLAPLVGRAASDVMTLTEDDRGIDRLLEELRQEPETPEARCRTSAS